jgi:ELWxxDGT repeat protein
MAAIFFAARASDAPNGSGLFGLVNVNGTLLFWAELGTKGLELWKSDGTKAGTMSVKSFSFTYDSYL